MTVDTVAASTITVGSGGNYSSIQGAVNNTTSGDTILVYPGTYLENVNVNKELTIKSYSGNPDDTIIRAANSGKDVFHVTANNVTINRLQITGAKTDEYGEDKAGVYLERVSKALISNSNISSNGFGISLLDSSNNTLVDNSMSMSRIGGILLWNSSNNRLNNNILDLNNHYGIHLYEFSNNNELSNNTVNRTGFGLSLTFSCSNTLVNNTVSINSVGVILTESSYNNLVNNSIISNSRNGIDFQRSNNNSLLKNIANSNNINGIFLINSSGNKLDNNYASNNREYGININNSSRNNILNNNTANSNGKEDIVFADPQNNTIDGSAHEAPSSGSAVTITIAIASLFSARKVCGKRR